MVQVRGINYDAGTYYRRGVLSRVLSEGDVFADMQLIKEVGANSVRIYGSVPDKLEMASKIADEAGLEVFLCPRFIDVGLGEVEKLLPRFANIAESVGAVFVAGNELSIDSSSFLGSIYLERMKMIPTFSEDQKEKMSTRLNGFFSRVIPHLREGFEGKITYSAGLWERIDWDLFDFVAVNLYRGRWNWDGYEEEARQLGRFGKPVLVTEFGCAGYRGASIAGPELADVIDWRKMEVRDGFLRDEREQAECYVDTLIALERAGVYGAFPFTFRDAEIPGSDFSDPQKDFEIFLMNLTKRMPDGRLVPTEALRAIGRLYRMST